MNTKINKLLNEMGILAIQIKQDTRALEENEKRYETLTAQVLLLQQMEQQGYTTTGPDSTE